MTHTKRMIGILVAVVSACALCLVLGACSGGANSQPTLPGKWTMCEVTQGGETITIEDADADLKAQMEATYFDIKDDGSIEISDMGMIMSGEWEETSPGEAKTTIDGVTITMKLEGDKLVATSDSGGAIITMKKA